MYGSSVQVSMRSGRNSGGVMQSKAHVHKVMHLHPAERGRIVCLSGIPREEIDRRGRGIRGKGGKGEERDKKKAGSGESSSKKV